MERPIEEVIGWTWDDDQWIDSDGEFAKSATVDHLAAWLASRGYAHTMAAALLEGAQGYVRADLDFPPDAILAALTAAVRKVAGDA